MLEIIGLAFLTTLCIFFFVGVLLGIVDLIGKIKNKNISNIVFCIFLFFFIFVIVILEILLSVV